ncbi:MAG TPA: DUF2254 family protein [Streptosporangiaceae bacterium]|nr:DUF2254 family protein [Streptosporangiaceae bacterium]
MRRQQRLTEPLLDLRLFRSPAFTAALTTNLLSFFAGFGALLFIAPYLQLVLGLPPLAAGLWMLPASAGSVLGATLTPVLTRRVRPAFVMAAGLTLAAAGFGLFTQLGTAGLTLLVAGSVVFSLGLAPVDTLATDPVAGAAPAERAGAAAALSQTSDSPRARPLSARWPRCQALSRTWTVEVGVMGRDALREYVRGSLWVLPTLSVLAALAAGAVLSSVSIGARSPLAFQGTPDDARTLLLGITGTMITVIALLLGLAVVALQLSSTQFSPRLLRNFLRDRPNQVVLSAFVATFAYSAAGLYTVGVSGGNRTAAFPRLAVSGAIVLLLASLGLLVFFADHLLHSIQVDAIMETVQRNTLAVIENGLLTGGQEAPEAPAWAVAIASTRSGYVQTVRPGMLLPPAARHGLTLRLRLRVGEHVVAGTTLAWIWPASPGDPAPDPRAFARALDSGVRIGFERTLEQDAAFGIRQLVDVACKALSPAVNDPYTAVQAVDHLSVIFCALGRRPLGTHVVRDGDGVVIVPARRFGDYLSVMCGLIRRYGASEPTVAHAMLRLLGNCAAVAGHDPEHCAAIEEQARIIVSDAEREITQPADLGFVHAEAGSVLRAVTRNPSLRPSDDSMPSLNREASSPRR